MAEWLTDLTIPGEPMAKGRPRVTKHGTYTPKTTVEYENRIRAEWHAHLRPDMPESVRVVYRFYLGTHRRVDVDNLVKAAGDALNGLAYEDDWRIHEIRAEKWYTPKERARTEIVIYSINPYREERE